MPLTDQRIRNLERATDVRMHRAEFKRQVKAGEETISSALPAPTLPSHLVGMEIGKVVALVRGVGYTKAVALCEELRINALNPLGKLTYRQRRVIASHVKDQWERDISKGRARPGTHGRAWKARASAERSVRAV